ncbi:hypothetical protein [Okeania sp. SIO2B3]|uniref:hypothetical protein n=1 Tax=Okeania sp. SIO2B3 TaxID=2607784 RepID=UPI0013BFB97E|nr:hypothetical protein [Okeania sp. SIO2B3]NET44765.1 hypothetical protein [Okeania sp. SIO2B3]
MKNNFSIVRIKSLILLNVSLALLVLSGCKVNVQFSWETTADQLIEKVFDGDEKGNSIVDSIVGNYENHQYDSGGKNDWHYVTISRIDDTTLQWRNRAGRTWTLQTTKNREILKVGKDCPYFDDGHTTATVIWDGNQVSGILGPWNELYEKSD